MLIDELMPHFDVSARYVTRMDAPVERCRDALFTTDLANIGVVRVLMALRSMPGLIARGPSAWRRRPHLPVTLASLEAAGFRLIATTPGEVVLGVEGRFWTLAAERCTPPASVFRTAPPAAGTARALWNFTFVDAGDGVTIVTTETRVLCADASARRQFLLYWTLIKPGSGLIRLAMLRAVRKAAEQGEGPPSSPS